MDSYWLGGGRGRDWDAMKDAFPGVNAIISFGGVGFNDARTEALVEVYADSTRSEIGAEIMLLKKKGPEWSVLLRHIERETTSGEWSGAKCEPADAPSQLPEAADIEKLTGRFGIHRIGASKAFRGQSDVVIVRLEPLKPSGGRPAERASKVTVIDAKGEAQQNIDARFELRGNSAVIVFSQRSPEGMMVLDGWYEEYRILRTDGRGFFGGWSTSNGPTSPLSGYFCARPN
jgi:hypothetical protein